MHGISVGMHLTVLLNIGNSFLYLYVVIVLTANFNGLGVRNLNYLRQYSGFSGD